jgi:hypothetical protein
MSETAWPITGRKEGRTVVERSMAQDSPQEQMDRMLTGYRLSQALYVAARLGLPDLLTDGPRTADDLAALTQSHRRSLYRLLRALASVGVFAEDEQRRFALTPLAKCLRSDAPGAKRAMALMVGELLYPTWGELLYSVQTGKSAFEKIHGQPVFEHLARHPEQARLFDEAMVGVHGRETAAMLDACDFSNVQVLADVGGGNGSVLTAVLRKYPHMRGILFDLPGVAGRATANVQAAGLADRCQVVGGDFFCSVPDGADAYLLRHIIHDWDDAKAVQILRNVHRAMAQDGRLLVVEYVIPPGNEPSLGKLLDLAMLLIPGGEERTEDEYRRLYEAAQYRLTRIVPTQAQVSVIEGERW